jgi:hypothetical protein
MIFADFIYTCNEHAVDPRLAWETLLEEPEPNNLVKDKQTFLEWLLQKF